jgi:hypothetical protein
VFEGDHGARGDAVQHQGPQQHGRRRAAGNAQVEQRDHGAAHAGVVGRFTGQNAFEFPFAEGFRMLGGVFGRAVGDPAGDVFPDAGHAPMPTPIRAERMMAGYCAPPCRPPE